MNKNALRVGLVGTGYIADFHARAIGRIPGVKLAAVADQNGSRARDFAGHWGVEAIYATLAQMLAAGGLDAVHILTPPDTHAALAREAIEAGVNVLVEKPLDVRPEEAAALCDLAEARGTALAVSHNFLFSEPYVRLREDVRAGRLGPLDSVTVTWNRELSFVTQGPFDVWMLREPANIMLEVGVHSVAHVCDLFGPCNQWDVAASNGTILPTGVKFFRRWQALTYAGRAAAGTTGVGKITVDLNFSFLPGVTEHTIQVRGMFGNAKADLENNSYHLDRLTPYSAEFDRALRSWRKGVSLAVGAAGNLSRHVFSKLKLVPRDNAYGSSITASVAEFYRGLAGRQPDGRIAPRFAAQVVAAAAEIGRRGAANADPSPPTPLPLGAGGRRPGEGPPDAPRVLVLGGSGFIGRQLVAELTRRGHAVRVLARNPASALLGCRHPLLEIVPGDLRRSEDVRTALAGIERVYHLARPAAKTWRQYQDEDVAVTRQVGALCLEKQIKRLIYTGTIDSLYLGQGSGTITDLTPLDAQIETRNSYSRAKAAGEELLRQMHRDRGLPLVVLRPAIVIGKDGGPCHWGVGKWNGLGCVQLWGPGETPLPLVLVEDVVAALVAALDTPGIDGRTYNLSGPPLVTARQYVREIETHAGCEIQLVPVTIWQHYLADRLKWLAKTLTRHPDASRIPSYRDWDCRSQQATFDCSGARRDLNWLPCTDRTEFIRRGIHEPLDRFLA